MKQVICMKWGTLYGPEYVNRLYNMVHRETTGELDFVCLTDNQEDINPAVRCFECPEIDIPPPHNMRGWRKLNLYAKSDSLFGLSGDWLYLDLDVVVTGPLDPFFEYKPSAPFIVMKNWTQPGSGIGNTSCYRFRVGNDTYLLTDLLNKHAEILNKFSNSQTYISRNVKQIEFWPDEWCVLFKVQCIPPWPLRFWKTPVLPESARVVAFPGVPNPHQAVRGEWPVKATWKKIYKVIKPATWINDFWND
ncbi:MAG: hypothetical protein R6V06_02525 [Kiritimatiellia bacterium]